MMEGTLNDRAGGDLHVNTSGMEERKAGDIIDVSFDSCFACNCGLMAQSL